MINIFNRPSYKNFFYVAAIIIFLVFSFFGCCNVLAQSDGTTEANATSSAPKIQIVATVEIYSAKIASQQDNQLNLSFDFFNKQGVQPGIKYAAQLFKTGLNGRQILVDEHVYPETVDLKEGETKKMEIFYTAPDYLQGEFSLWLAAKNSSGLPLAFSNLGEVELQGSSQYVEIIPVTCFLTIEGEASGKKYQTQQGVNIKPEQNLISFCQVMNHLSQDIEVTAQFQTFLRTSFGDEVEDDSEAQSAVELKANQKSEVSFYLPKPKIPQFYETKFWLIADDKPVSNEIVFRYAVAGQSATIENIIFDKSFYKKGETAQVQLLWLATDIQSGDQLSFIIKNEQGKSCSKTISQSLDKQDSFLTLSSPIIRDCNGPKIEATIKDSQGNILDSKIFSVSANKATTTSPFGQWRYYGKIIVLTVIALALLLALIMIVRKKKLGKIVSLFFVLSFVICFNFLFFSEAKAATGLVNICYNLDNPSIIYYRIFFTTSLGKTDYLTGEAANPVMNITYESLSTIYTASNFYSTITVNNNSKNYNGLGTFSSTMPVQNSPGNYAALFSSSWSSTCGGSGPRSVSDAISYTVTAPPCIPLGSSGCTTFTTPTPGCCTTGSPLADTCQSGRCCILSGLTTCSADNQCCAGHCNNQNKCGPDVGCTAEGLACPVWPSVCCGAGCSGGICCISNGSQTPCTVNSQCCAGHCNNQNKCGPDACTAEGLSCTASSQCCSGHCNNQNKCGPDACTMNGLYCNTDSQCCAGHCNTQNICGPDSGGCTDDCSFDGYGGCDSEKWWWKCGYFDSDSCLDFRNGTCSTGQMCLNGDCIPSCYNECFYSGEKGCIGRYTYTCRDTNGDSCLEMVLGACLSNQVCIGKGVCTNIVGCPPSSGYCSYASPLGYRIYDSNGILCPSGTLDTCPDYYTYCPGALFFNSCGTRCPIGRKVCASSYGYISVQSSSGPIKLNLISVTKAKAKLFGTLKILWKLGQTPVAADLVPPTDLEASPVRVKTAIGIMAWKKKWPAWLTGSCLDAGNACQYSDACCSKICSNGLCVCKPNTTACVKDAECCSAYCSVSSKVCECFPLNFTGGSGCKWNNNSQCCAGTCSDYYGIFGHNGYSCCLPAGASLSSVGKSCSAGWTYCCSRSCNNSTNICN